MIKTKKTWYIMSAGNWMRKPSVERIIEKNNHPGFIMVATLDFRGDKKQVFVLGAGDSSYAQINETLNYIQDTGNGYGQRGYVTVENAIVISRDGVIDPGNGIGLNEKRSLWVFK